MNQPALDLSLPAPEIAFVVHGHPEPAGSKRSVPMGQRWGVIDANPKSKGWKGKVEQVAGEFWAGRPLLQGPLRVEFCFFVQRPKAHFSAKGGVKATAPAYPTTKPDVLKLSRGVEDALSGVIYRDDAQIVEEVLSKRYGPERVEIRIVEL